MQPHGEAELLPQRHASAAPQASAWLVACSPAACRRGARRRGGGHESIHNMRVGPCTPLPAEVGVPRILSQPSLSTPARSPHRRRTPPRAECRPVRRCARPGALRRPRAQTPACRPRTAMRRRRAARAHAAPPGTSGRPAPAAAPRAGPAQQLQAQQHLQVHERFGLRFCPRIDARTISGLPCQRECQIARRRQAHSRQAPQICARWLPHGHTVYVQLQPQAALPWGQILYIRAVSSPDPKIAVVPVKIKRSSTCWAPLPCAARRRAHDEPLLSQRIHSCSSTAARPHMADRIHARHAHLKEAYFNRWHLQKGASYCTGTGAANAYLIFTLPLNTLAGGEQKPSSEGATPGSRCCLKAAGPSCAAPQAQAASLLPPFPGPVPPARRTLCLQTHAAPAQLPHHNRARLLPTQGHRDGLRRAGRWPQPCCFAICDPTRP